MTNEEGSDARKALDAITGRIIGGALAIHSTFGPGMLEKAYHDCLKIEFEFLEILYECQVHLPIEYRSRSIPRAYVIDVVVENAVVLELKAVEKILPVHEAQVLTYMKLSGCRAGLLINFNAVPLTAGIRRFNI